MSKLLFFFLTLISSNSFAEVYTEQYGEVELSSSIFFEDISGDNRKNTLNSAALEYNFFFENNSLSGKLKVKAALSDPEAAQDVDFNEAYLDYAYNDFNVLVGNNIVFWGKNEFYNPVDVVNSKDFSGGLAQGEKMGQPMINVKRYFDTSELNLFILPATTNTYPTSKVRPQLALNIDSADTFAKGASKNNTGMAARWSGYINEYDYGFSFYQGNTKDPALVVTAGQLVPKYSEITQLGLDVQATRGDILYKGEMIYRDNQYDYSGNISDYTNLIVGLEQSNFGIFGQNWDLANIVEYAYDTRGSNSHHGYQNDVFFANRITLNDIHDTSILLALSRDLNTESGIFSSTISRRIFGLFKTDLEVFIPLDLKNDTHLASSSKDKSLGMNISWFW